MYFFFVSTLNDMNICILLKVHFAALSLQLIVFPKSRGVDDVVVNVVCMFV